MRQYLKIGWTWALIFIYFLSVRGQEAPDFMMQGWYWDYPKLNCEGYNGPSLATIMAGRAAEQSSSGFTLMWLPPMTKASFGDCSNGYDPQDLFDYGNVTGRTGLGTGAEVEAWISALSSQGMQAVADVVYNHRDGGDWEDNPAVRDYVMNYPTGAGCGGFPATPYPVNGKFRYRLPLGGTSGLGAGEYYFKFSSASQNPGFSGSPYKLYFQTSVVGFQNQPDLLEIEPNGGGNCGQPFQTVPLGVNLLATIDNPMTCSVDEFQIVITPSSYLAAGDFLEIYIEEIGGGGTGIDIRPFEIWYAPASGVGFNAHSSLAAQTRTNFESMPSNLGGMNYLNFKPNGQEPTCLTGDLDFPFFFFDIEQTHPTTGITYDAWNKWLWNTVGIRGYRMDAVKHFPAWFVGVLMNELHSAGINPAMAVGEHFTSDPFVLKDWVDQVQASMTPGALSNIPIRAFDFDLRDQLRLACEIFGYDVRNVFNAGMVDAANASGLQVVTFTNNHDFRYQDVYHDINPLLSYAYILTNNKVGLPCVFYPDYYGATIRMDDGSSLVVPSLKDEIDELMAIHTEHIFGANFVDYLSRFSTPYASNYIQGGPNTTLLYQIRGGVSGKDVVVAINFAGEELEVNHTINTGSPVNFGDYFVDQTGNALFSAPRVENAGGVDNSLYIRIPAQSYAVYVQDQFLNVDFVQFSVEEKNNLAHLTWEIVTEHAISSFDIEKSLDGKSFTKIGTLQDINESQKEFDYVDLNFVKEAYYRITALDNAGHKTLTPIRHLKTSNFKELISIYPNPSGTNQQIAITTESIWPESMHCSLYQSSGTPIFTGSFQSVQECERSINSRLQHQPPGVYYLTFHSPSVNSQFRLIRF